MMTVQQVNLFEKDFQ